MKVSDLPFTDYADALARLTQAARLRTLPSCYTEGRYVRCGGHQLLNFSGNDYLGLAVDTHAQKEALEAAHALPLTSSSSRLLTGNHEQADALEQELAAAYQRPALLFGSGYHANSGLIPALFGKETLILADKLVHASMIDGIRLSAARHIRYRHNDMAHLQALLEQHHRAYRRIAIITESVFSMDGDCADLLALVTLKQAFPNVVLYVDEAHALGVYGATGLGLAQASDTLAAIDILVATFGKAAASYGAFAILHPVMKAYLINTARTLIFSTALPPAQLAVSRVMFRHLLQADTQRAHLHRIGAQFRQHIAAEDGAPHIVPWLLGDDAAAVAAAEHLQAQGFYCLPIRPPTVAAGSARIRFSFSAAMRDEEITSLAEAVLSP